MDKIILLFHNPSHNGILLSHWLLVNSYSLDRKSTEIRKNSIFILYALRKTESWNDLNWTPPFSSIPRQILIVDQWDLFAVCFYSPVWCFNFCDLFALTLTYLDEYGTKGTISPGYHLDICGEYLIIFWFCIPETENVFIPETPIENQLFKYHLNTNERKNETSIEKGHTGDSSHWSESRSLSNPYYLSN